MQEHTSISRVTIRKFDIKRLLPYPYAQPGNDFAISSRFDNTYGRIIQYKEKEIGRTTFDVPWLSEVIGWVEEAGPQL